MGSRNPVLSRGGFRSVGRCGPRVGPLLCLVNIYFPKVCRVWNARVT